MRKPNIVNIAAFAAGICLAIPSYANDVWQFTVTSDQNGPDGTCYELSDIPCSITGHESSYILGILTINAPLAGYRDDIGANGQRIVEFDDQHIISFRASPTDLMMLNFPPVTANYPLAAAISVNEVGGNSLSGFISLSYDFRGGSVIVMTGMHNLWTGYWSEWGGQVHQFWARSDRVMAIAQH